MPPDFRKFMTIKVVILNFINYTNEDFTICITNLMSAIPWVGQDIVELAVR